MRVLDGSGIRRIFFSLAVLVGVACGGATESDLFATADKNTTSDASAQDTGTEEDTSVADSGNPVVDTGTPDPVKPPIEIAQLTVGAGEKFREKYSLNLRNVSSLEIDRIDSLGFAFNGGKETVFDINCKGAEWLVSPGDTVSVPDFETFSLPGQAQLYYRCEKSNKMATKSPTFEKYQQSPLVLTVRGRMADGTDFFASYTQSF